MGKEITIHTHPAALKLHSVVYQGSTPAGRQFSVYIPRETLEQLGVFAGRPNDRDYERLGVTGLPDLDVTFKEA